MGPIESAVVNGSDLDIVEALLVRCARIMDESNSARDVKALSIGLMDALQMRRELRREKAEAGADDGPGMVEQFRLMCRGGA